MDASDPKQRFSATVDLYAKHRPDYPASAFDAIAERSGVRPPARVLDLGCGTGISSRALSRFGYEVVGVDPNADMLERARVESAAANGATPPIEWRVGECTATGLAPASVDLIVAAQAFHWFPIEPTVAECKRVLRSGHPFAALWNRRAKTAFLDGYEALIRRLSTDYAGLTGVDETLARISASPSVARSLRCTVVNEQRFDRDGLRGRAWSSSYVAHGVADKGGFDRALDALFDEHASDGSVSFAYDVEILVAWPR
ncbi:MAG: class I SAM-dependent methyltransferase [Polyangiales bacterium]